MRRVLEQEGGSIRAPGVPTAGDRQATKSGIVLVLRNAPRGARVKWKDQNSDVLCRRRVVRRQGGGSSRAPGVPSAGDRQETRSGIVLVLRSAPWSARVKWKDRDSDVLCRRRVVRRQGGGNSRAPGVPSAGDRQSTKSGIVPDLRSATWSARVKWRDRGSDVLCRRRVVRRQGGGSIRASGVPSAGDRQSGHTRLHEIFSFEERPESTGSKTMFSLSRLFFLI